MQTHSDIPDGDHLRLLGEILQSDMNAYTIGALRLRMLQPGFSWQALIELATGQEVLLALILALTTRSLLPPIPRTVKSDKHVTARLQRVYAVHLAYRMRERQQLDHLLEVLKRVGIAPLILKGARYLVEPLGEWCEARPMGDFDILLRSGDIKKAWTALSSAGYRPASGEAPPYKAAHHLPPLAHPDHPQTVEIHVHALAPAAAGIMSTRQVWDNARRAECQACWVLPPVWHALHGLLHHQVQDRGHAQRKLCVKGLWEWSMLARGFGEHDWSAIRAHMRGAGALEMLDSWLLLSRRLFGLDVPWPSDIPRAAAHHADATLRRAFRPYWVRRSAAIADELRVSFARPTLAAKYEIPLAQVSLAHAGRNLMELLQRHQGRIVQRLAKSGRP